MPISAFLTIRDDGQKDGAEHGLWGKKARFHLRCEVRCANALFDMARSPSQAVTPIGLFRKREVATAN